MGEFYWLDSRIPTQEEMILLLAGKGQMKSTHCEDHPEFAKLRNELEESGYIKTSRNSRNGDYVIKSFKLNDRIFKVNDRFLCGSAIKSDFKRK
jgi:hypothetical protein